MNLLHPWMLLAGLAVGLPLLIHWLTRPKPVRLPLSTIRFVQAAVQQRRAHHRLRDIILLALRVLAVLLIALAFARPLIGARPVVASDSPGGLARVVILDQSQGMGEVYAGATAFDRARAAAATYLTYSPSARFNLILAGAKPHPVVDRLTGNFSALREELSSAKPLPQKIDTVAALNMAADLLSSGGPDQKRELVIVSNFQRSNWASVDFSALPKDTKIQLETVAPKQAPANLAILKITPRGRVEQGREAHLDVEVGNYSPAARDVTVNLNAGSAAGVAKGVCPPGKVTLSATMVLSQPGWVGGEAKLAGAEDALPSDNARAFVLSVRPAATYALVTRESAAPVPTSSQFLERALAPFVAREGSASTGVEHVRRIMPDAIDRDALANADLIVIDHPGKLSPPQAGLLVSLLRRGKPVLYVAAEPVDATNLKLLAESAGTDLKMPVEFAPPPAAAPRRDLFLTEVRGNVSPFAAFGDSLQAAIGPLRFGGGLSSHPLAGGLPEDVLAGYSDHSACLVSTACAAGALAVLNADLNESNLVASPIFVPLLDELIARLMSRQERIDASACGEALVAYLPAEAGVAAGLIVAGPDAVKETRGTIQDDSNAALWRWNAAGPPGVYSIMRGPARVYALATAAPAITSDLQSLDPDVLKTRLAGGRSISVHSADNENEHRDNLWSWALVVCCGCLLMELLVLRGFKT